MTQTQIWLSISLPLAIFSLITSYILFIKYKPLPQRKILIGALVSLCVIGAIVASAFISEYLMAALVGLLLPPLALWTWFLMQPAIRSWDRKKHKGE